MPESPPDSLTQVIETNEIESIRLLNFAETYPKIGRSNDYTFLTKSVEDIEQFQSDIDEVLQKYSVFMEPELVDALQKLKNSELFRTIMSRNMYHILSQKDPCPLFAGDGYLDLQDNLAALLQVIEYYEHSSSPELTLLDISYIWKDDEQPKIGSARIDVPLECIQSIDLSEEPPHDIFNRDILDVIEHYETK